MRAHQTHHQNEAVSAALGTSIFNVTKKHFKASQVTGTAVDVTVSQRAPEEVIIHPDTESALQATSVAAQVKHTASSG